MKIVLVIATLATMAMLPACEPQKTATERTEEIETFADPQIQAYEKAKKVQGVIDSAEKKQQDGMHDSDL